MTSTSSLRVAHVADLHLGAGYVHGDEDRGGVNSRLYDFRRAWAYCCEQMVEDEVDLVGFAGDAFRDSKPTPTEEDVFRVGLDILADADIPIIAIPGNHDIPRAVGRTNALKIFDGYRGCFDLVDRPRVVVHEVAPLGGASIPVACFPYPSRAHLAASDPEFEKLSIDEQNRKIIDLSLQVLRKLGAEAESKAGAFGCILLAHGTIAGSKVGAEQSTQFLREPVLPLSELRSLPFKYQAWGHLHRAQALEARIRYSGSIERCDFAEAEEDKGWWLVELGDDPQEDDIEWRSSDPRPFIAMDVPEGIPDIPNWITAVCHDCAGAVVRVTYTATPEQARTVDHAAIRRSLLDAGAAKVHGPFAKITHTVTEASEGLTEQTDLLDGWQQWATLQGVDGRQFERLDREVREALEVLA